MNSSGGRMTSERAGVRGRGRDGREDNDRVKERVSGTERNSFQAALRWTNKRVGCRLEVIITVCSGVARLQRPTHLPPV